MKTPVEKLPSFSPRKRLILRFVGGAAVELVALQYTPFLIIAKILEIKPAVEFIEHSRETIRDAISDEMSNFLRLFGRRF